MKNGIHPVDNFEELAQLRRLTLGNSDFKIVDEAMDIDSKDQVALNLGYYENNKLLATMRFFPVHDRNELERQLDYTDAHQVNVDFPGVVIGKAGSLPEARGKGYIRELLIHGLKYYQARKIAFAALTTKPSNNLNGYFETLGFVRKENPAGWHRFGYDSGGRTFVFLKKFDLDLLSGS